MITGLNTDVRHRELVLHVQTEDKGVANPCIETLVYAGGQILDRRRRGYRELLASEGKAAVVSLMESQHRALIDQIRSGSLDSRLREMGMLAAAPEDSASPAESGEAEPEPTGPTLDRVILDYLNAEAEQEHLVLLMDAESELKPGLAGHLSFEARTSLSDEPVPGAMIQVRLISPASEPMPLGEGVTDAKGRLQLDVALPSLAGSTAALIVRAESSVGDAEIKHLI